MAAGEQHGRGMDSSGSVEPNLSGTTGGHRAREDAGALVGVSGATVDRALLDYERDRAKEWQNQGREHSHAARRAEFGTGQVAGTKYDHEATTKAGEVPA